MYDQEHFQGRRMEFTASCQNIMECGMENIRSLKVECGAYVTRNILPGLETAAENDIFCNIFHSCFRFPCSWVGYEHSSFCGQQFVLEKGDYPCIEAYSGSNSYRIERMISFRPICCAVGLTLTMWKGPKFSAA